jgi:hypothetical protein
VNWRGKNLLYPSVGEICWKIPENTTKSKFKRGENGEVGIK